MHACRIKQRLEYHSALAARGTAGVRSPGGWGRKHLWALDECPGD